MKRVLVGRIGLVDREKNEGDRRKEFKRFQKIFLKKTWNIQKWKFFINSLIKSKLFLFNIFGKENFRKNLPNAPTTSNLLPDALIDVKDFSIPLGPNWIHRHYAKKNTSFKPNIILAPLRN